MKTLTVTLTALALLVAAASAATHVVDPSDSLAYATIAAAVAVAGEGDTVLVKPGTYTGEGNRDIDIPDANFVLMGEGGSAVTIIDGEDQNNHHCFNLYSLDRDGHDASMVIQGFTIRNFVVSLNPHGPGAAIRLQFNESPTLRDLVIEDCQALATWAAGIYCNNNCSPVIEDVVIQRCSANNGSALYCTLGSSPDCNNLTIQDCSVTEHGNVYIAHVSNPDFENSRFEDNESATDGGAVYIYNNSSPGFVGCYFIGNTAATYGGAVNCYAGDSSPGFGRCTFVENSAGTGGDVLNVVDAAYPGFYNSILAFNGQTRGTTVQCGGSSVVSVFYCCMSSNAGGDDFCGSTPSGTNFFVDDPLFCNIETLDLTLASNSPCLAENNGWTQSIGAESQGCTQSSVEEMSWGSLKAMYR